MILVTGGAGFIRSNFVLDWLPQSDEPIINLDALTYVANLENLASLQGDPRHTFVQGSIGDFELVSQLLKHTSRAPWSILPPSRMLIAKPMGRKIYPDQYRWQLSPARSRSCLLENARRRGEKGFPLPACLDW